MKNLLLFIGAACATFTTSAQDYYPVKVKDIYYYTNDALSDAFPLKIDSVKLEGKDSVYFMYKQIRRLESESCTYTSLGDSWLGNSIRVKEDGTMLFANREKNPFTLKTQAKLNEKWTAFSNPKWVAIVEVSAISQESFLGLSDSVKTFTINIIKPTGADTTHSYDGIEIKISKKYGITKTINFYLFGADPNPGTGPYSEYLVDNFNLSGIESLKLGLRNITGKEIFHYSEGDEFHIEEYSTTGESRNLSKQSIKYINTIVKKSSTLTAHTYSVKRVIEKTIDNIITSQSDTISETHLFDELKEIHGQIKGNGYLSTIFSSDFKRFGKSDHVSSFAKNSDDCLVDFIGSECLSTPKSYYVGLGGPYYHCAPVLWNNFGRKIMYYKKGTEEWGQPLVLGTSEEETLQTQITVSPNPSKDVLNFNFGTVSDPMTIQIIDNTGQIVQTITAVGETKMDVSKFKKGLYLYHISSSGKKHYSGKIIVE